MKLIKVSRSSFLEKQFDITESDIREKFSGDELEAMLKRLPTEEEKEFAKIFRSKAPELARVQRKMSICLHAEIITLEKSKFEYAYNDKMFSVSAPTNSFTVSQALEDSVHLAVLEMNKQASILVDGIKVDLSSLEIDELKLLVEMIDRFFFQIYL